MVSGGRPDNRPRHGAQYILPPTIDVSVNQYREYLECYRLYSEAVMLYKYEAQNKSRTFTEASKAAATRGCVAVKVKEIVKRTYASVAGEISVDVVQEKLEEKPQQNAPVKVKTEEAKRMTRRAARRRQRAARATRKAQEEVKRLEISTQLSRLKASVGKSQTGAALQPVRINAAARRRIRRAGLVQRKVSEVAEGKKPEKVPPPAPKAVVEKSALDRVVRPPVPVQTVPVPAVPPALPVITRETQTVPSVRDVKIGAQRFLPEPPKDLQMALLAMRKMEKPGSQEYSEQTRWLKYLRDMQLFSEGKFPL